jgi:hypothetical protein
MPVCVQSETKMMKHCQIVAFLNGIGNLYWESLKVDINILQSERMSYCIAFQVRNRPFECYRTAVIAANR